MHTGYLHHPDIARQDSPLTAPLNAVDPSNVRLVAFIFAALGGLVWAEITQGAPNLAARRLLNQGLEHSNHYRLKQAEQVFRTALAELEKTPSTPGQKALILVQLAAVQREHCQFDEALITARQALTISQTLKGPAFRKRVMETPGNWASFIGPAPNIAWPSKNSNWRPPVFRTPKPNQTCLFS